MIWRWHQVTFQVSTFDLNAWKCQWWWLSTIINSSGLWVLLSTYNLICISLLTIRWMPKPVYLKASSDISPILFENYIIFHSDWACQGNLAKHAAYAPRLAILTNHQILGVTFVRLALLKAHTSPPEVVSHNFWVVWLPNSTSLYMYIYIYWYT